MEKLKIFDSKEKFEHVDKKILYEQTKVYQVTPLIQNLYSTGESETSQGNLIPLRSIIRPLVGYVLYRIILENNLTDILEIGTGFGIASLYMLEGLAQNKAVEKNFTTIDPNQNVGYKNLTSSNWSGSGLINIYKSGHSKYMDFIEEPSYLALPRLIENNKKYDLVFLHAMQLFDYQINDILLIDQLTKIGSVIFIAHGQLSTIQIYEYIKVNYKHWKYIKNNFVDNSYFKMYIKIEEDTRSWNFFEEFD